MEAFRTYLQQEFLKRTSRNEGYSLRAFARQLGMNHATLSTLISGKRKISPKTILKLSQNLRLSPQELNGFLAKPGTEESTRTPYHLLEQEKFSLISEWYFDAILELSLVKKRNLSAEVIADALGLPLVQARMAFELLQRQGLLVKKKNGAFGLRHPNSTNILDANFSSAAQRKYQRSILEKSLLALEDVSPELRDHSSVTVAVDAQDLPEVKKMIRDFRRKLNAYVQRREVKFSDVYQLQLSFFPLTRSTGRRES